MIGYNFDCDFFEYVYLEVECCIDGGDWEDISEWVWNYLFCYVVILFEIVELVYIDLMLMLVLLFVFYGNFDWFVMYF